MYHSILQFIEKDIKEIERFTELMLKGEKDADDLSTEIHHKVLNLGNSLLSEIYEKIDEEIRESIARKKNWNIERRNEEKEILDIMGTIRFTRTGYENKKTGEYIYLLDQILGIDSHQRITLGAAAQILEETILTSYEKGGKAASHTDIASKQAVKKLVHETVVEMPLPELKEKRKFKNLHIIADEDHVAAQFWREKGDLLEDSQGRKINTIMPKIICLYEDVINESGEHSENPRYKLIGKHYFCGVYAGEKQNIELWQQVSDYIEAVYDTDVLERVYIAGDGGAWIKTGCEVLDKSRFVLDKFHMMKYVNVSVAHLLDSADDAKSEIWEALNGAHKEELKAIYQRILNVTENENKVEEVKGALRYFSNHWNGIKIRVEESGGCWKCCAEGQVSHVLSARMSSRPMGWSELGCDQMAQMRAYKWNGGKIIDLLKYQKQKKQKEEHRKEQEELIKELKKRQSGWDYAEKIKGSIPGIETTDMNWMRNIINEARLA